MNAGNALVFDADRNAAASGRRPECLSSASSPVQAWIIPTDEERQIAVEVCELLSS